MVAAAAFPATAPDRPAPAASPSDASAARASPPAVLPEQVTTSVSTAGEPRFVLTAGDRPGFVTRHRSTLFLDGKPYRFTGVNAYELTSWFRVNRGCGAQVNNLDAFFRSLRPGSMVRVSANQQLVLDKRDGRIDFTPLDRVVAAATRHGQKLILALASQDGTCDDGHWKDARWYAQGFRHVFDVNDTGLRLSFLQWVRLVVPRYALSPAVGMWQLVGEPEASDCSGVEGSACYGRRSCAPGATATLRRFFDSVGAELKRLDPLHLLGTGSLSTGQCGFANGGYRTIVESPPLDVVNYHDYGHDRTPLPAAARAVIGAARAAGKPVVIDEAGILAGPGCGSRERRARLMSAKIRAAFAAGVSGFLPWNWEPRADRSCGMSLAPRDPLLRALRRYTP